MSGGGGDGISVVVVIVDFVMSFLYAWISVFIKIFVYRILGFHHDALGEAVLITFKIFNTILFQFLSKKLKGGTYNPITVLYHSITGDFNHILFALNARIPAQVIGAIYAVKLIKKYVPGPGFGPHVNVPLLQGALIEGALTLVYVTISMVSASKVHSGFFLKAWISAVCKNALIVIGSDYTETSINPASVVGWAYARGQALSDEHLLVYWIFPFEATLLAVWISSFLVKPHKEEKEKVKVIERRKKMTMLLMGLSFQTMADLIVAGFSLVIGLGIFAFTASVLCSAAFIYNAKLVSSNSSS
ncbi:probable aquaporin SIP2-1 [Rutidosis leptorrhynchoides]|uniref:probable aquaporin SIP2-1 n=1 Tax=Rutidosis leptorrhynchoides TaxID=125765 RepID=UPI003A994660